LVQRLQSGTNFRPSARAALADDAQTRVARPSIASVAATATPALLFPRLRVPGCATAPPLLPEPSERPLLPLLAPGDPLSATTDEMGGRL
jgi:hypothetical protein